MQIRAAATSLNPLHKHAVDHLTQKQTGKDGAQPQDLAGELGPTLIDAIPELREVVSQLLLALTELQHQVVLGIELAAMRLQQASHFGHALGARRKVFKAFAHPGQILGHPMAGQGFEELLLTWKVVIESSRRDA